MSNIIICAGPCLLQSKKDIELARKLKDLGADIFRSKPYRGEGTHKPKRKFDWQNYNYIDYLKKIQEFMPIAIEIDRDVSFWEWVNYLWIPARQMQNYCLLEDIDYNQQILKVILKRHFGCTIDEWLGASEYLPNCEVIFCERGISSFDRRNDIRWRPDILGIVELAAMGKQVWLDVSHSCGRADYIIPLAKAAVAAGAQGVMVEVRENPDESWSDQKQHLNLAQFEQLVKEIKK